MIILDEQTAASSKATVTPPIATAAEPPPPYTESHPLLQLSPVPLHASKRLARKRFLHTFAVAAIVWILVGTLSRGFTLLSKRAPRKAPQVVIGYPLPDVPKERPLKCLALEDWTVDEYASIPDNSLYRASAFLDLPPSTDAIFLLANGLASSGSLHVVGSADVDQVRVNIVMESFGSRDAWETARVCLLERDQGQYGVGIVMETRNVMTVKVEIPMLSSSFVRYKGFETSLPRFRHHFSGLGIVRFGNVSLTGSGAPMELDSLLTDQLHVYTSDAPISGTFHVSKFLSLETSVQDIQVNVSMHNDNHTTPSKLLMKNTGSITGVVRLSSGAQNGSGGSYDLNAFASHSDVILGVADAPLSSVLRLDAVAQQGRAIVSLPLSYEGPWIVESRNTAIISIPGALDPSGRGRRRHEEQEQHGSIGTGRVWWGDEPSPHAGAARVSIRASTMALLYLE